MIIDHNLGLPRYAIGVRFFKADDTLFKGGVFSIHTDDRIELDDDWLADHPEIASVEVFGVGDNYEGKVFGLNLRKKTTQESFAELGRALDELGREVKTAIANFIAKLKEKIDE